MVLSNLKHQDWLLYGAVFALAIFSLLILYSVAPELFPYQLLWFGIGLGMISLISQVDLRPLLSYRWIVLACYLGSLLLLGATLMFGSVVRNTKGWLVLGPLRFQTAELSKVLLIVLLAYFFARRHTGIAQVRNIVKSFLYFFLPTLLVLFQPDGGSAIVLFGIWIGFLLVSGIPWRYVVVGLFLLTAASLVGWGFLENYQQERIIGFLNPDYDPLGINYSVIQSKIAIGSAGWLGKGFNQGTQVQLRFLPEPATDFILSAFIEEWGFLGGIAVVAAFLFLLFRIIAIGARSEDNFSRFVCMGAVIMFLVQFGLNVGSALGLFPVVGVTFPFMSYGGSSLLTNAILVGIIQSIAVRSARR